MIHPANSEAIESWTFDDSVRQIYIGRAPECNVWLLNSLVSRKHASIERINDCWVLNSIGRNGCYLNERPIRCEALQGGEVVAIARIGPHLLIRIEEDTDEMSAAQDLNAV